MPLILSLAAPGSHCRLVRCSPRLARLSRPHPILHAAARFRKKCFAIAQPSSVHCATHPHGEIKADGSISRPTLHGLACLRRVYASNHALPETASDVFASTLGVHVDEHNVRHMDEDRLGASLPSDGSAPVLSRRARKRLRCSPSVMVLNSIHGEARNLYWSPPSTKFDYSYVSPAPRKHGGIPRRSLRALPARRIQHPAQGPVSLYTILSRQLEIVTNAPWADSSLTPREIAVLASNKYSARYVQLWTSCILHNNSIPSSAIFEGSHPKAPLFLVLLFLRRNRVRAFALGTVMRHLSARLRREPIEWKSLQVLIVRLLRHARKVWPESMPWIASLFCREAARLYHQVKQKTSYSSRFLPSLTRFCNTMLWLISVPTQEYPIIATMHREKAQFLVLQFMASCEPALTVTRRGFRGAVRNQLAHAKTEQEKEWAKLKGLSWPPWKENRNAMDENKGYMFAASRASRILHRSYEAGYEGRQWEQKAEVYAGWDTDLSPTIQTRIALPKAPSWDRYTASQTVLWAARIRTTRTRREAWACFLACESSNAGYSQDVYLAMFEKLHYSEIQDEQPKYEETQPAGTSGTLRTDLLPGDMKEVIGDPKSPLHLVYISEPVPTYDQLYHRMWQKGVRPKRRLLAFLIDTLPEFSTCLSLLEASRNQFDNGVQSLLHGSFSSLDTRPLVPDYFIGSFVRFLCRFGRFGLLLPDNPIEMPGEDHLSRLKVDRKYRVRYAYTILMHFRPAHRPAWTAYMQTVLYRAQRAEKYRSVPMQYTAICEVFETINSIDLDPDDDQFRLLCAAARYFTQAAYNGNLAGEITRHVLSSAPALLRTAFHNLVGANVDPNSTGLPRADANAPLPHVPGPAALHAYVRALGFLRDFEGLYSFSSWITIYHDEVTARANAQHDGPQMLYWTLLALRAALEGTIYRKNARDGAPEEIKALVKAQIEGVEEWEWPPEDHVKTYVEWQAHGSSRGG